MLELAKRIWPFLFSFFQILITDSAACVPYKCGTVSKRNKRAFQQGNSETIRYFQNAAARKSIGDIRLTKMCLQAKSESMKFTYTVCQPC